MELEKKFCHKCHIYQPIDECLDCFVCALSCRCFDCVSDNTKVENADGTFKYACPQCIRKNRYCPSSFAENDKPEK
jgi:hypothetical protein